MVSSPKPPPAPDPAATAAAQGAANRETALAQAELNMINQTDAFGNKLVYNPIGKSEAGNPRYEAIATLSPEQQALLNKQTGIYGTALDTATNQINAVKTALGQAAPTYDENYRQQQLAAMLSRQQPNIDRERNALLTRLANQGITDPNSEAYKGELGIFNQRLNDMNLAADVQAGAEARNALQAAYAPRSQSINELSALLNLGQVQTPQLVNTPQTGIQAPDIMGATALGYQGAMNNYNQQMASRNSMLGGLAGLGGAALGGWAQGGFKWSDMRLKTNIEKTAYTFGGFPVYSYRYVWSDKPEYGVMAQDVEKTRPDAVRTVAGFKMVNYGVL